MSPVMGKRKRRALDETLEAGSIWATPGCTFSAWTRFLVVHSEIDQPMRSLNLFQNGRALRRLGIHKPKSVVRLHSGDLLLEVSTAAESERLLKTTCFGGIPVSVERHATLNSSKGVVKSRDLDGCSEEEIVTEVKGVTHARRIIVRRGDKEIRTNTWVLTFDTPKPPTTLAIEYLNLPVRPYVPNPMRCFNCHRFGHTKAKCHREAVCPRCGKGGHSVEQCSSEACCLNCKGEHSASSKECPRWQQEKVVLEYRAKHGGTFTQARAAVFPALSASVRGKTYAAVVRDERPQPVTSRPRAVKKNRGDKPVPKKAGDGPVSTHNRFSVLDGVGEEMDSSPSFSPRPTSPIPSLLALETSPPSTAIPSSPSPGIIPEPSPSQPSQPNPSPSPGITPEPSPSQPSQPSSLPPPQSSSSTPKLSGKR